MGSEMCIRDRYLEPLGLTLEEDALVLVPSDSSSGVTEIPDSSVAEGFESIALVPSTSDRLPEHSPLDPYTLLMPLGSEEGGLLFPIPWLVESDSASTWQGAASSQPALVRTSPRECDLILVGEDNLVDCAGSLGDCAGVVLDLADMPPLNDAEIEAILVSITCKMSDDALILLRDCVDRADHLFRLVVDHDLDGAVIDAASPGGSRAASALPRIGLAARAIPAIVVTHDVRDVLALDAQVLCLDEPTAGLAQRETEAFGPLLKQIQQELGATMVVIEHDMPMIMALSDRVYCLEAGQVIAEGLPDEVRNDPTVVASYLGTDQRAIDRSDS